MIATFIKMIQVSIIMGMLVGLLMYVDSRLNSLNLMIKILALLCVVGVIVMLGFHFGIKAVLLPFILFLVMSFVSAVGLFAAIIVNKILEKLDSRKRS